MKKEKRVFSMVVILVSLCACTGQGVLPPMPSDALEVDADVFIEGIDDQTGDTTLRYTLIFKNISDQTLEKVILKDFDLPSDITMDKEYFETSNLRSGEEWSARFVVVVRGWGLNPTDQEWTIYFTTRIEEGSAYTEETSHYDVYLTAG